MEKEFLEKLLLVLLFLVALLQLLLEESVNYLR